jgi:hypothetical protein
MISVLMEVKNLTSRNFQTKQEGDFKDRADAEARRDDHIMDLQGLQERLYAEGKEGVLNYISKPWMRQVKMELLSML